MATETESIRFAGEVIVDNVQITSLNGVTQNVTGQIVGIEIFEDIYSPFLSGNIVLKESLDFINLIPLTGEEVVDIKLHTPSFSGPGKEINARFYLYKLGDRELDGDKNQIYRIHFVSMESIVDLNKKMSKSFSGKVSDIAKTLITDKIHGLESIKKYNIEDTPITTKYTSNFWSPVKNLNYICRNALTKNGSADFLFFENRDGLNFVSLEMLYGAAPIQTFISDKYFRDTRTDNTTIRNVQEEYKRIIELSIPRAYDHMDNSRVGMYASKLITYDIVTKTYASRNYYMTSDWDKHIHMNANPSASNNNIASPWAMIFKSPKYFNNYTDYSDVTNTKTILERNSKIKQLANNKLEIMVPGRTDYTVGKTVQINFPKLTVLDPKEPNTDIYDEIFSGKYLITACNHLITRKKHEVRLELMKDSYKANLNGGSK